MICRLVAWLIRTDFTGPWTTPPRGGGPCLDRQLYTGPRVLR